MDAANTEPRNLPESEAISEDELRGQLDGVLAGSLRPVSVGLALFYALLGAWYAVQLQGPALATMTTASGLLSLGMLAGAFWFERNRLPPRLAHPVATVLAGAVIVHCLLLLVTVPQAWGTTNLMIAELGFGCLLLSMRWFIGISIAALVGWAWVVGGRTEDPLWYHFGLALGEAILFGALVLYVRIRAYRNLQLLRMRDQRLMRRIEEASAEALAAAKAKSAFLANMSHEIRTPMTAMLGMGELLGMTQLDETQKEYTQTIERSGQTLLRLVNDILDLSKIEAGQLKLEQVRFNLEKLLNEVRDMLAVKAKQKGLELHVGVAPEAPNRYLGDPTRIKQVLVNLVGNALKFTQQGHVAIVASAQPTDEDNWLVTIEVQDTGIGIAEDKQAQVFEAFAQAELSTNRKFGGTGLGLAISQQLVRMMGGALSVKSELGKGSTFAMTLPLQGIERPSTVTSLPSEGFSQFRGRVLVVDDGEDARRLARELLMGLGVHVETVDDGEQALARLERGKFDLVFMDCQMPKLNGYDATREIRRREGDEQHTTIVALSASVLPDERAHCAEAGMDDYVAKPFSGQDLARVLRRWLPAATLG